MRTSPVARLGRYRAETFTVDAQESGAQRLTEAFFRKCPGVEILTVKVESLVTKIRKMTSFRKTVIKNR